MDLFWYLLGRSKGLINSPQIPSTNSPKDVNFYDYDGTFVVGYTIAEAQVLTELPTVPDHSANDIPLTFQEWNYTLEQVKATTRPIDVGATYLPSDGKTYFCVHFESPGSLRLMVAFLISAYQSRIIVDWGDGSTPTIADATVFSDEHTYPSIGDYIITITVPEGFSITLGRGTTSYGIFGTTIEPGGYTLPLSRVQEVYIGERVTGINAEAFGTCRHLTTITIPNSVVSIGEKAFQVCKSLGNIVIPNNTVIIRANCFEDCPNLKRVILSNSVTSIGTYAFTRCLSLSSISIPDSVTTIGTYAFNMNRNLRTVTLSNSMTTLSNYIFSECSSLESIIIPDNITSIGNYTFNLCFNLKSVTIPDSVISIGTGVFYNCSSLQSVIMPNGVTILNADIFHYCASLKNVIISGDVTSIDKSAFDGCVSLGSIMIPSSVTNIGQTAFYNCCCLTSISIPSGVTSIAAQTFQNCYGMGIYDFSTHTSVPTLADVNAFQYITSGCKIRVPSALYDAWKVATNWAAYASYIVAV